MILLGETHFRGRRKIEHFSFLLYPHEIIHVFLGAVPRCENKENMKMSTKKVAKVEGWKGGRLERWKVGKVEGWKGGRVKFKRRDAKTRRGSGIAFVAGSLGGLENKGRSWGEAPDPKTSASLRLCDKNHSLTPSLPHAPFGASRPAAP